MKETRHVEETQEVIQELRRELKRKEEELVSKVKLVEESQRLTIDFRRKEESLQQIISELRRQ